MGRIIFSRVNSNQGSLQCNLVPRKKRDPGNEVDRSDPLFLIIVFSFVGL